MREVLQRAGSSRATPDPMRNVPHNFGAPTRVEPVQSYTASFVQTIGAAGWAPASYTCSTAQIQPRACSAP